LASIGFGDFANGRNALLLKFCLAGDLPCINCPDYTNNKGIRDEKNNDQFAGLMTARVAPDADSTFHKIGITGVEEKDRFGHWWVVSR
jgi:hypothetical protein